MSFKNAVLSTEVESRTFNGMKTLDASLSACVDLFYAIGSSRKKDISPLFEAAYQQDRVTALRILAWARDIRGGAGERSTYTKLLNYIEEFHVSEMRQLVEITPVYGRWKDLLELKLLWSKSIAYEMIANELLNDVHGQRGLCAKWMPRKGPIAVELRKYLGLSPKAYRKLLVNASNVVETQMCAKQWDQIEYGKVPSVAAARYQKAFTRHDAIGYAAYLEKVKEGTDKINASAVYPYDVIKSMRNDGNLDAVTAQWNALPNYVGDKMILPVVDVSGSMSCAVSGTKNLTCLDVAISLGLYLADKNKSNFKDLFLTFSSKSKFQHLKGNIVEKYNQLSKADWEMSTNLHSAFEEILKVATKHKLPVSDMPGYIMILSDMEFDACTEHDDSAMQMISRKYATAGYDLPKVIFWNLNANGGNTPVRYDETGTALISGFSPSIMKSVLSASIESFTPETVMLETVNAERYQHIV